MRENRTIEEWKNFLANISTPIIFLLCLSIIGLFLLSSFWVFNNEIKIILTSIIAILTGVVGARIERIWSEAGSEKLVAARGKIATRSLGELLFIISKMKSSFRSYSHRISGEGEDIKKHISNEYMSQFLAHNIDYCDIISENVINSLENWNDVIPQADITKEYRSIVKSQTEKEELVRQIEVLEGRIETEKQLGDKEKEQLESELNTTKKELKRVKNELESVKTGIVGTIGSGGYSSLATTSLSDVHLSEADRVFGSILSAQFGSNNLSDLSQLQVCKNCGRYILEEEKEIWRNQNKLCSECFKK